MTNTTLSKFKEGDLVYHKGSPIVYRVVSVKPGTMSVGMRCEEAFRKDPIQILGTETDFTHVGGETQAFGAVLDQLKAKAARK